MNDDGKTTTEPELRLRAALEQTDPSGRLQAALDAGTYPDERFVEVLVERSGVEPDFSVRETLTWALTRHSPDATVARLVAEVTEAHASQRRSQSLHSLSKIGDPRGWAAISDEVLVDADDEVARTAWRAAVALAPDNARPALARTLASQLGRGDRGVRASLSRALSALGDTAAPVVEEAATQAARRRDTEVRRHAIATLRLIDDPDESFETALFEASRVIAFDDPPAGD